MRIRPIFTNCTDVSSPKTGIVFVEDDKERFLDIKFSLSYSFSPHSYYFDTFVGYFSFYI